MKEKKDSIVDVVEASALDDVNLGRTQKSVSVDDGVQEGDKTSRSGEDLTAENGADGPLLQAAGISKIYSQGAMAVGLHRFSASFYRGEFVAITGSSGSGKSTLLNLLSGLDSYDEGELYFKGAPTSHYTEEERAAYRKDNVAFIFQDYYLLDSYTVFQNIELALLYTMPDPKLRAERVKELIEAVGLTDHTKHRCSQLSGGQKQRVSIARALAKDAPILFADEPCGNLDTEMTADVMRLLHDLCRDKLVLMVTHSYEEVAPYATRKIRLADGECVEDQVFVQQRLPIQETVPVAITKKQVVQGLVRVASNNIKATPKRSFFGIFGLAIMTTIFIWVLLTAITKVEGADYTNNYNRNDVQVYKDSGAEITDAEMDEIRGLSGVAMAIRYNPLLNMWCDYEIQDASYDGHFRPLGSFEGTLYAGRMPQAEGEVLLTVVGSRRNLRANLLDNNRQFYVYDGSLCLGKDIPFKVVGITLGDSGNVYMIDSAFTQLTYVKKLISDHCYTPENVPELLNRCDEAAKISAVAIVKSGTSVGHVQSVLHNKGLRAMYLYERRGVQDEVSKLSTYALVVMMLAVILVCYRFTAGSYRALEGIKRRDYNIMRTVGLPNSFIKWIYYVEMVLQAFFAWIAGGILSILLAVGYGLVITPSVTYGLKMIGDYARHLWWIILLSLVLDMVVTIYNARHFNNYFYRQTVKASLQGGRHD